MEKDERYQCINALLESGKLKNFTDIFDFLPKTTLKQDLGIHHITFDKQLKDLGRFTLNQIYQIAGLCEIDKAKMIMLIHNENSLRKQEIANRAFRKNKKRFQR